MELQNTEVEEKIPRVPQEQKDGCSQRIRNSEFMWQETSHLEARFLRDTFLEVRRWAIHLQNSKGKENSKF